MSESLSTRLVAALLPIFMLGGGLQMLFFSSNHHKKINYAPSDETFVNPLIGYAPRADNPDLAEQYSLVYVDITWRELEPEKGKYAFDQIEEEHNITHWQKEGKRAVLRFVLDKPRKNAHMDIPDWLYEKTGDGVFYDTSYGKGYSPNYANPTLIAEHEKAIIALGKRYAETDFFAYIQLGSLGHWGEWHVKYADGIPRLPDEATREKYVLPYISAFPETKILMRRPFSPAARYDFGVYNDMAGDPAATETWMDWIINGGKFSQTGEENAIVPLPNVWEYAPIGGELTSGISMDMLMLYDFPRTKTLILQSHMSFLGPKIPTGDKYKKNIAALLSLLGYRYRIQKSSITHSLRYTKMRVSLDWTNDGSAPIYYDWQACLYIYDQKGRQIARQPIEVDLTTLQTGKVRTSTTTMQIGDLPPGTYSLYVGIEDPKTGKPAVKLAMKTERNDTMSLLYTWNKKPR